MMINKIKNLQNLKFIIHLYPKKTIVNKANIYNKDIIIKI